MHNVCKFVILYMKKVNMERIAGKLENTGLFFC